MKKTSTIALAALAGLVAVPASATFTFDQLGYSNGTSGSVTFAPVPSDDAVFSASWQGTPFGGYVDFTSDTMFDISFASYSPDAASSDVSGFILALLDAPAGTETLRLTDKTDACAGAGAPLTGDCDFITGGSGSGGNTSGAYRPGETIFTNLGPGSYRIGIYDSSSPPVGAVSFNLSSVADVPAPGALALLGLGLLGVARRRRA